MLLIYKGDILPLPLYLHGAHMDKFTSLCTVHGISYSCKLKFDTILLLLLLLHLQLIILPLPSLLVS